MKPDDVTSKMVEETCKAVGIKEIIAAAFNAVVSDDSPITAEWLMENGYANSELFPYIYKRIFGKLVVYFETDLCRLTIVYTFDTMVLPYTETIGQLRALHAGLGIEEVGT